MARLTPLSHWKLNDNAASTVVVDAIGTANGVYTDLAAGVNTSTGSMTGVVNTALDLDTDEWIDVGNQAGSVKTISLWCSPDAVNVTDYLIDLNGTDYITVVNGTVTVNGFAASTEVIYVNGVVATTLTAGSWYHVAVTAAAGFTAGDLDIGRLEGSGYFNGGMDNVMLFSGTLTAVEVRRLYNNGHGSEIPAEGEELRVRGVGLRDRYER